MENTSQFLQKDVEGFCVACYNEAEALVILGIKKPIIIMGESFGISFPNVIFTAATFEGLEYCLKNRLKFNLKINTGMNRIGFELYELNSVKTLCALYKAVPYSVFSHLFNPSDQFCVEYQMFLFNKANEILCFSNIKKHIFASNCLTLDSTNYFDFVRCGLSVYGYGDKRLLPAMTAKTRICQIHNVKAGNYIGYGNYKISKDMTIATIKAGYGDGFRRINGKRYVSVKEKLCEIVGQVCMDMTMIDVSKINVKIGDSVFLLGEKITLDTLADSYGTITYEALTGFNALRSKRIYVDKT